MEGGGALTFPGAVSMVGDVPQTSFSSSASTQLSRTLKGGGSWLRHPAAPSGNETASCSLGFTK